MNVVIYGAGCIGTYFGGCLQLAQLDVTYIGRAKLRDTIAEHGLVVSDLAGNEYHFDGASTRVDGSLSRSTLERAGDELVIVVAVKSRDTMSVAREIYAAISSQMQHHRLQRITIISLQNGVTNGNVLRTALAGLERAVVASDAAAATTTTTSERQLSISIADASFGANVIWQEPNRFYLATDNPLYIGSEKHGHVSRIVRALNGTKQMLRATETPNIRAILYSKLLVNLNNSCNALAGIPLINQLSDRRYRVIVAAAIEEGLAVLKAANIELARIGTLIPSTLPTILRLPDGIYRILAAKSIRIDRNARSSDDLVLKRKTEVAFLNGEIISLGKRHGIKTPINDRLLALIQDAEQKAIAPSYSGDELCELVLQRKASEVPGFPTWLRLALLLVLAVALFCVLYLYVL